MQVIKVENYQCVKCGFTLHCMMTGDKEFIIISHEIYGNHCSNEGQVVKVPIEHYITNIP